MYCIYIHTNVLCMYKRLYIRIGERPVLIQTDQACLWHPREHGLKDLAVPVVRLQRPRAAQNPGPAV